MKIRSLIFFCLFFLSSSFLKAQELKDTNVIELQIKEVTITATKKEKDIENIPFPISIINSEQILSSGSSKLNEVIKQEVGIITVPTKIGTEGIQIQGIDASYTTILIDGFPLIGRSFGTLDLQRVSLSDVKRIELLRGASSSLYGSNAIGGVVNVITERMIEDGKKLNSNIKFASYNTINPSLGFQYKEGPIFLSTSFDYYQTDGYDLIKKDNLNTINPFSNYTIHSNLGVTLSDKIVLEGTFRAYHQNQLNKSFSIEGDVLKGKSKIKELNAGSSLKYLINPNLIQEANIYTAYYRSDEFLKYSSGDLFEEKYFDNLLIQPELITKYNKNKMDIIFGLGLAKEGLARPDFSNKKEQNLSYAYTQIDAAIFKVINLILGSRYDNYTNYDSHFSHKMGLGLTLSKKISINGSIGSGFKVPDFRQRYFDFTNSTIGYTVLGRDVLVERLTLLEQQDMLLQSLYSYSDLDKPLQSETSININLGLRYRFNPNMYFNFNLFKNRINNLIETQLVANMKNGLPIFSYFNLNEVETQGFEMNFQWDNNTWKIRSGYQLLYAFDNEIQQMFNNGQAYANDENGVSFQLNKDDYIGLFNRSKHMANLQVSYNNTKRSKVNVYARYRSEYALNDSNGNNVLDKYDDFIKGYTLYDINYNYRFDKQITIQLGVDNILDFKNPKYISNISGRLYYINLKFNMN